MQNASLAVCLSVTHTHTRTDTHKYPHMGLPTNILSQTANTACATLCQPASLVLSVQTQPVTNETSTNSQASDTKTCVCAKNVCINHHRQGNKCLFRLTE